MERFREGLNGGGGRNNGGIGCDGSRISAHGNVMEASQHEVENVGRYG
jgi:hypothetical protein